MTGPPVTGPPEGGPPQAVAVREWDEEAVAREGALVLQALDIACALERGRAGAAGDAERWRLLVAPRDAERAHRELLRFELENRETPVREVEGVPVLASGVDAALGWSLVLVAVHVLQAGHGGGFDWEAAGIADAAAVRAGEWWRVVTALTLHDDLAHLAGNVFFGALFVGLLCRVAGTGAGLLATLLAGAAGNTLNALVQSGHHRSLGASTAVFGALGVLATLMWRHRTRLRQRRLRRWAPVVVAVLLLGYLGTGGPRTDVVAHVAGLGAGLLLGALPLPQARATVVRRALPALVALLLVAAWSVALAR